MIKGNKNHCAKQPYVSLSIVYLKNSNLNITPQNTNILGVQVKILLLTGDNSEDSIFYNPGIICGKQI